jgi:hypothetical protein
MRQGLIIDYKTVAALLANESDEEQTAFFKTFLAELRSVCRTNHNAEMQLAGVNQQLTDEEKELIGMLGYKE